LIGARHQAAAVDTKQRRRISHGATAQQPLYCSRAAALIAACPPQPLRTSAPSASNIVASERSSAMSPYATSSVVDVLRVNVALALLVKWMVFATRLLLWLASSCRRSLTASSSLAGAVLAPVTPQGIPLSRLGVMHRRPPDALLSPSPVLSAAGVNPFTS
jgi:hypothetical protein